MSFIIQYYSIPFNAIYSLPKSIITHNNINQHQSTINPIYSPWCTSDSLSQSWSLWYLPCVCWIKAYKQNPILTPEPISLLVGLIHQAWSIIFNQHQSTPINNHSYTLYIMHFWLFITILIISPNVPNIMSWSDFWDLEFHQSHKYR